jgi:hypothetical protein
MTALRPNYRRAREIKAELDQLAIDRDEAEKAGKLDLRDDILDEMDALETEFFRTGVTSEYEL